MKACRKLIITFLFNSCILNSSIANSCNPSRCSQGVNNTFLKEVAIAYPFYIKDVQPESCGLPQFELYCDNMFGTCIQLPDNVVLRVHMIYYEQKIILSDPFDNCVPKKLMSLNLIDTPFAPASSNSKYWLYNCSGHDDFGYDRIGCLSDSKYSVISSRFDIIDDLSSSCSFMQFIFAPTYAYLSNISTIDLTWIDGTTRTSISPVKHDSSVSEKGLVFGLVAATTAVIFALLCWCRYYEKQNDQALSTLNTNSTSHGETTTINTNSMVVGGLDQVTIDSYPVIVIGESGRLVKPDDNTCPICLDDYQPRESLKILPECLHRFHVDCIDQWLRSKGICPICRHS